MTDSSDQLPAHQQHTHLEILRPSDVPQPLREKFCEVFATTGSFSAAAAQIGVDIAVLRGLRRNDPAFARDCSRSHTRHLGELESHAKKIALQGEDVPIVINKRVVKWTKKYDTRLLLRLLAKESVDWRESTHTQIDQKITSQSASLTLDPERILAMSPEDQQTIVQLLEKMMRQGQDGPEKNS